MPILRTFLLAAALIAYLGTGRTLVAQPADDAQLRSVELPPELDRVLRDYEKAWRLGDARALAGLFTEDGFVRRQHGWVRGRDSVQAAYKDAGGPLRLRALDYAVEDSVGYMVGGYGYGRGRDVRYTGKFILALRRGPDGRWLIAADLDG